MDNLNEYLLDLDPDDNYYNESENHNHNFCVYESIDEFKENYPIASNENKLTIISQNIRSFNANLDNFLCLFDNNDMPEALVFF